MKTEEITIANLGCGGCVNTITKKLTAITGVEKVEVDLKTNNVSVNHDETVNREQLTKNLLSIGYPERNYQRKKRHNSRCAHTQ